MAAPSQTTFVTSVSGEMKDLCLSEPMELKFRLLDLTTMKLKRACFSMLNLMVYRTP